MAIRRVFPRNEKSALDNIIGADGQPIIKKQYPRQARANADSRASSRLTNVDSRFSTLNSCGWGSE
jgi:hypothetical protein